jgi:isochorismate synthase EntC
MPNGKPAGVRCVQLTADNRCAIFADPRRPAVCASLQPEPAMCGSDRTQAMAWLAALEAATACS